MFNLFKASSQTASAVYNYAKDHPKQTAAFLMLATYIVATEAATLLIKCDTDAREIYCGDYFKHAGSNTAYAHGLINVDYNTHNGGYFTNQDFTSSFLNTICQHIGELTDSSICLAFRDGIKLPRNEL